MNSAASGQPAAPAAERTEGAGTGGVNSAASGLAQRRLRSALFAPASRPDLLAKLPRSRPDGVIIDLEDAVAPDAKPAARPHAAAAARDLRREHPEMVILLRVNAVNTEWFAADMAEAVVPELSGVVVPKLDSAASLEKVIERFAGVSPLPVVAGIETVAGVEYAVEVLRPPVEGLYFGAEDYVVDLGGVRTPGNAEVLYARSKVAAAARLCGVSALDQVVVSLKDEDRFKADAAEGRALGYGGKLCIHPAQVPWANEMFSPSAAERERASRLLEIYEQAKAEGKGAVAFEGQMVDEPLARQARAVLADL